MGVAPGSSWLIDLELVSGSKTIGRYGRSNVERFEWKSIANNGYIVRARLADPNFTMLRESIEGPQGMLSTGRQSKSDKVTFIKFTIKYDSGLQSNECVALITDLHATGGAEYGGSFEFVAIDPVSYFINNGNCSGKAYRGKIGGQKGVIYQILNEYLPDNMMNMPVKITVGDTKDSPGIYYMMRQDPKTFIMSLLDWSAPFTNHQTSWMVASGIENGSIVIRVDETYNSDFKYPKPIEGDDGPYTLSYGGANSDTKDIIKWELLTDNLLSVLSTKLVTSGMSVTSGLYMDRISDQQKLLKKSQSNPEEVVFVKDKNTQNKSRPLITSDEGFAKPTEEDYGWTDVQAVPEITSSNDMGIKYSDYVSGKARQTYIELLNMIMRIRITVRGQPRLNDSIELSRTKVTLSWMSAKSTTDDPEKIFLDGDWQIYGWHHKLQAITGLWSTDIYLSRMDYDALSNINSR